VPRIDLDVLVPEEITFVYQDREYAISGDIDVDTTFDLIDLLGRHGEAEASDDRAAARAINKEMEETLLGLFQERQPDLDRLPFGVIGYRIVLSQVLQALGLQVLGLDDENPRTPRPKRASRSRRSTGSSR